MAVSDPPQQQSLRKNGQKELRMNCYAIHGCNFKQEVLSLSVVPSDLFFTFFPFILFW